MVIPTALTSLNSLIKRIQSLEQQHNPDEARLYKKIRVDFVYPVTRQRWTRLFMIFCSKNHPTHFEFGINAEEAEELNHPDPLYCHEFTHRWMERHPDAFNTE
jgi:hypothetical protein